MKVQFSLSPEEISVWKRIGFSDPPETNLFILICKPVTLVAGSSRLTLSEVPLAGFALKMLNDLYRLREVEGLSELEYHDFYGGLNLLMRRSADSIRIENSDSHLALQVSLKEAVQGFQEFGEAVLGLVGQHFPDAPGLDLLKDAVERCASG